MGIRHIAGPREWGAYQQALLVSELKDDENVDFKDIGEMLGISSVEAARRYRAVGALKTMEKDELFGSKAEPSFYRLFHELVSIPEVRARFGWSASDNKFSDIEKAREFFALITGGTKSEPKLQTFGDVRKLRPIVGNIKAEESLFDDEESLADALKIVEQGKKPQSAQDLLLDAKKSLSEIGFAQAKKLGEPSVAIIDELLDLLTSIRDQIQATA